MSTTSACIRSGSSAIFSHFLEHARRVFQKSVDDVRRMSKHRDRIAAIDQGKPNAGLDQAVRCTGKKKSDNAQAQTAQSFVLMRLMTLGGTAASRAIMADMRRPSKSMVDAGSGAFISSFTGLPPISIISSGGWLAKRQAGTPIDFRAVRCCQHDRFGKFDRLRTDWFFLLSH